MQEKLSFALQMDIYARNMMRYRYFCYKSMNQWLFFEIKVPKVFLFEKYS